jgi:hypothetical protein
MATPSTPSNADTVRLRYYLDTEFIEDGQTIELISLGIVCDDGREYYAEVDEVPWEKADQWVLDNVKPHLMGGECIRSRQQIAEDVVRFVSQGKGQPQFWGYYADYDWVVLCRLYGRMIDLPSGWPMYCMDLIQLAVESGDPKLPGQRGVEHHALADARWNRHIHQFLLALIDGDDRG